MGDTIRIASVRDLAAVQAIVDAAYTPYIARIGREPGPMLDDYGVLIDRSRVYVLEHDRTVSGLLVLIPEGETMLLDNIAVVPAAQGMGLGRKLMHFAEEQARNAGCTAIQLYTHVMMTENLALYARAGYVETHRAVERGLHRVYMTKRLG